ncbi:MAG: hypothetical protein MZU97_02105 [Bacillus subtilis]|nr:hypothetical protein [Bacillus subtilis]
MEEELALLQKWSESRNLDHRDDAERIINIRLKELKNLIATNYVTISSEIYNGYKTLEKYFENISKYR